MKLKLVLLIMLALLLSSASTASAAPAPHSSAILAGDYEYPFSTTIAAGNYYVLHWDKQQNDGIYGDFQVTSGNDIDFFICDQTNYDLWTGGSNAQVYNLQQKVGSYSFTFIIPATGTWYFVYSNTYSIITAKDVTGKLCQDLTPPTIDMNLDSGATYGGIKEITATITEAAFDIGSVQLSIDGTVVHTETDSSFSYSWNTANYADGTHTIKLTASDNVGNSDSKTIIVYTSNAASTSTNAGGQTGGATSNTNVNPNNAAPMATAPFVGLVFPVLMGVVGLIVVARRGGSHQPSAPLGTVPPPTTPPSSGHQAAQTIISQKVLVICPYCSSKVEQGITVCPNCGAKL